MFKLGLTGSIGMGKSTTARLFKEEGCDIWDADAAVHRLYAKGGRAVAAMSAAFPEAVVEGSVSRERLKTLLSRDPAALTRIEKIVHPLVAEDRAEFLAQSVADIVVFDIPLLFEKGGEKHLDAVACVSVGPEIQRKRVLERGTMTEDQFRHILSKQMPDAEKRAKADFVIITDTLEHARAQVHTIVEQIKDRETHA
ncbi:dephospho-CoA kinase [Thalassococcus sp. S3]|uniref:dephospho-CoA kinase n=1 Tax=Thalassococcus sp. S3 TaxID=2017482 RepID=UPI001023F92D|nr:dephospho-CoA kinase [Thalassococcus sp. S3]QBF29600.1 dephospho-CoA kinase [Thalassococcus sp. S3]